MHLRLNDYTFQGKLIYNEENNKRPIKISGNKFHIMQPKNPKTTKL